MESIPVAHILRSGWRSLPEIIPAIFDFPAFHLFYTVWGKGQCLRYSWGSNETVVFICSQRWLSASISNSTPFIPPVLYLRPREFNNRIRHSTYAEISAHFVVVNVQGLTAILLQNRRLSILPHTLLLRYSILRYSYLTTTTSYSGIMQAWGKAISPCWTTL